MSERWDAVWGARRWLVFAVICIAWLRSYSVSDFVYFDVKQVYWEAWSGRGDMSFCFSKPLGLQGYGGLGHRKLWPAMDLHSGLGVTRVAFAGLRWVEIRSGVDLIVPWWMVVALCGGTTIWFGRREKLRGQEAVGKCVVCGYDLRGNVSGVCPECGERIEKVES